jgi:ATP-binding cassette subfamily G (WHITE) protein 2
MDRVLLMGGNGNAVYCGPMRMLGQHFHEFFVESRPEGREFEKEKENNDGAGVLDFVLDHVLRFENAEADDATRGFKNSEVRANDRAFLTELRHSELKAPSLQNTQLAPFKTQLKLLCGRLLRKTSRHPFLLRVVRISQIPFTCLPIIRP